MKTIQLTRGKQAVVCDCHYEKVSKIKWQYHVDGYAVNSGVTSMHRYVVADIPVGYEVDHINKNRLDNRCSNLRAVPLYNNRQRSKYSGIRPCGKSNWGAEIKRGCKRYWLGSFSTKDKALAEYRRADAEYHTTGKITVHKQ